MVLLSSYPSGIQGESTFHLLRNDFTLCCPYVLPMLVILISASAILPLFLIFFKLILERGEREREREILRQEENIDWLPPPCPDWGSRQQPGYVP